MSKPDAPETPEGEKLQVKLAEKMFSEGTAVKASARDGFMASNRRDERSNLIARVGASSAKASRERLTKDRKRGKIATVDGGVDYKSAGISQTGKGGRSYDKEGDIVRQDTSSTARLANSMASHGQRKSLDKFTEDNEKTQRIINLGTAAVSAYGRLAGAPSGEKDEKIADEVSTKSILSASNYDVMGAST